jgi:hypothetical protein
MKTARSIRIGLLIGLLAPAAIGCSCVGVQPFCNALPVADEPGTAIFVGHVASEYPAASREELIKRLGVVIGARPPALQDFKDNLLRVLAESLSPEGIRKLQGAGSFEDASRFLNEAQRTVKLDITERFVGAAGERFEVTTGWGGGDCGVEFKIGDDYLVVAHQDKSTGAWSTSICSRTGLAKYRTEDLNALRNWKQGLPVSPSISGTIQDWTNRTGSVKDDNKPLSNKRLLLRSGEEVREAVTDGEGSFAFQGLNRKVYTLDPDLPNFHLGRVSDGQKPIDLNQGGCAQLFTYVEESQGEIHGQVGASIGKVAEYLWVEAVPTNRDPKLVRTASSPKQGAFVIDELEPGDYWVAINVHTPPSTEHGRSSKYGRVSPYPPLYFPGVTDPSGAVVFHVDRGQSLDLPRWLLPEQSKERTIEAVALKPDGSPAVATELELTMPGGNPSVYTTVTDNQGKAVFYGVDGVAYRIQVAAREGTKPNHRGFADIASTQTSATIQLELGR